MRESLSRSSKTKAKVKVRVVAPATRTKSVSRSGTKTSSTRIKASVKKLVKAKPVKVVKPAKRSSLAKRVAAKRVKAPAKKLTKAVAKTRKVVVAPKVKAKVRSKPRPKVKAASKLHRSTKIRSAKIQTKRRGKVSIPLVISPPPLPQEPPRRQVSSAVLRAFEQAVKVFNRRQFAEAKPMFENLQTRFPNEVEIIARAQTYIQVCNQKLEHASATPRNADELYDRGVFALNIGDFSQARAFFEKALRLRPDEPHLLYSLAATHAQTGAHDQALDYLYRSIQIQPRFRSQALNDTDFSGLRENKRFLQLLGLISPFERFESRR